MPIIEQLLPDQAALLALPQESSVYLHGPATCGKSTAAMLRMQQWLDAGIPADQILILGPQKSVTAPYLQTIREAGYHAEEPAALTMGGIARRMCQVFWPLVQDAYPFSQPARQPTFLTLETALYYLAQLVDPLLDQGYFASITIDRNRLYSQILDNLNKSALTGLTIEQITQRLMNAWVGDDKSQLRVYQDAETCAKQFRDFCYQHHLLDYSLQMEIFSKFLWQQPICREFLNRSYTHLIYENMEEDPPVIHHIMEDWLPDFQSAVLLHDTSGGFRTFMGADPENLAGLSTQCEHQLGFATPLIQSESVRAVYQAIQPSTPESPVPNIPQLQDGYELLLQKFIPQMLDEIADRCELLIRDQRILPNQIAVISPFVSDALYFSLNHRLQKKGFGLSMHRPSRSLKDEAAVRSMLTFARLAHPQWNLPISTFSFRSAVAQTITGGDILIADRVARVLFNPRTQALNPFGGLKPEMQQEITYRIGEKMEALTVWLQQYKESEAIFLDSFVARLYGELLSQPGYPFHEDRASAGTIARLMASIRSFRWSNPDFGADDPASIGKAYVEMVDRGILAALSYEQIPPDPNHVLLLPAYTFLTGGYQAKVQFWLNPGNPAWAERLYQPLTHPYVLSPAWPENKPWTQSDEQRYQTETLQRLVNGLLLKCSDKVYFCITKLNEQGQDLRGPMLNILQQVLRANAAGEVN